MSWQKLIPLFAAAGVILGTFYLLKDLLTPFILSVFLAYLLSPVVDFMERRGFSRAMSIAFLYLGFAATLGVGGFFLKGPVMSQVKGLTENMPEYTKRAKDMGQQMQKKLSFLGSLQGSGDKSATMDMAKYAGKAAGFVSSKILSLFAAIPTMILVPFITMFFLKDGRAIKKFAIGFVPNRYFEMALTLLYEVDQGIGRYIRGQLMDSVAVGALYTIGLFLAHIKYAFILGPLAGIFNLIPMFGPLIGAVPAMIVTAVSTNNFLMPWAWIAIITLIVQLIDNVVTGPLIVGQSVDMHPLVIIFSLLVGAQVMGLLGMLIAIPAATAIKVTFLVGRNRLRDYEIV